MSSDPWIGSLLMQLFLILVIGWCVRSKTAADAVSPSLVHREDDSGCDPGLCFIADHIHRIQSGLNFLIVFAAIAAGAFSAKAYTAKWVELFCHFGAKSTGSLSLLALWVNTLVCACVVGFFGFFLPETTVSSHALDAAKKLCLPLKVISVVMTPVTSLFDVCAKGVMMLMRVDPDEKQEQVTEEEIRSMVDIGSEHGAIEETEKEMIENIFEFNNHTAEDVMIHRTAVDCIWVEDDRETVLKTILETGRSRFPVYDSDMDDIVGVLNTRDFLLESHAKSPRPLRELLREAYFVPETVQADALFRDMQKNKIQMSIVVDEYGGMAGIVTMEDLLEEIVGNIYDETDKQLPSDITCLGDNLWRISGSAYLEDIADELDVKLPLDEEYDTLSGLIFDQFTTIPEDGTQPCVDIFGLHVQVEKIFEHHVEFALVSKEETAENTDGIPEEKK